MPRISKKRKQEWALFLNERNRITVNALCRKCQHNCKQSFRVAVIVCPKFLRKERMRGNKASENHLKKEGDARNENDQRRTIDG